MPSGLRVERKVVFGERFPFEKVWVRIPAVARAPFLWTECLISQFNLKELAGLELKEQCKVRRACMMDAILLMRKPEAA